MRAREIEKCKCPICNKGSLFVVYDQYDKLYWEFIPSYIECDNCNTRFSEIVLSKNHKNVEAYKVEKMVKYWYDMPILVLLNQKNDKFISISHSCPRLGEDRL